MTPDSRQEQLFFELFSPDLPRQGPGDTASTLKALGFVPTVGPDTRVLDIGCGTGPQTLVLAEHTPAHITAIDNHAPFIDALRRRVQHLGLADRIDARVGDMRHLDVEPASFDLIWSEGAAYVMGFEAALCAWRQWLAARGHVAITEVCWTRRNPPPQCQAFWDREYPAIRDVATRLKNIEACGYRTVGTFTMPPSAWWVDFYRPLQARVMDFRERHRDEPAVRVLADRVQQEIDAWRTWSAFYGYQFFVMRAA